jgi:large subunit ribosomal protein L5e
MKGAADGGLEVPHNTRRFPGFNGETKKFDPAVLRKYIFGGHVADYQKKLQESDAEKYKAQFSQYVKAGVKPDGIEAMWTAVHKAIRADPTKKRDPKELGHFKTRAAPKPAEFPKKDHKRRKISVQQRKARVRVKLLARARAAAAPAAAK